MGNNFATYQEQPNGSPADEEKKRRRINSSSGDQLPPVPLFQSSVSSSYSSISTGSSSSSTSPRVEKSWSAGDQNWDVPASKIRKSTETTTTRYIRTHRRVPSYSHLKVPDLLLPPQHEFEAKLAFQLFDEGTGRITVQDIERGLKTVGQTPLQHKVREMVREIDQNGDGSLDFGEFCKLFAKFKKEELEVQIKSFWPHSKIETPLDRTQFSALLRKIVKNSDEFDVVEWTKEVEGSNGLVSFDALLSNLWAKCLHNKLRFDEATGQFVFVQQELEMLVNLSAERIEEYMKGMEFSQLSEAARKYIIDLRGATLHLTRTLTDREGQLKMKDQNIFTLNKKLIKLEKDLEQEKGNQRRAEKALRQKIHEEERKYLAEKQQVSALLERLELLKQELDQERHKLLVQLEIREQNGHLLSSNKVDRQQFEILAAKLAQAEKELEQEAAKRASLERELKERINDQLKKNRMEVQRADDLSKRLKETENGISKEREKAGSIQSIVKSLEDEKQVLVFKNLKLEEAHTTLTKKASDLGTENTQLRAQLNHLGNQNKRLSSEIAELRAKNENLSQQVSDLVSEIKTNSQHFENIVKNLESQLTAEREENNKKANDIKDLLLQLNHLRAEKQKEIEALVADLNSRDAIIKDLEFKYNQLFRTHSDCEGNLKTVQHELQNQINQYRYVQKQLEAANAEIQKLHDSLTLRGSEFEMLTTTFQKKVTEIQQASNGEINLLNNKITEQENRIRVLCDELVLERQRVTEEKERNGEFTLQISTLQTQLESWHNEYESLKIEKVKVDQEKIELLGGVEALQVELKSTQEQLDALLKQIQVLRFELDEEKRLRKLEEERARIALENLRIQFTEEIAALKQRYESQIDSLTKRLQEEEREHQRTLAALNAERQKNAELTEQLTKLRFELERLQRLILQLEEENRKLTQIIESLRKEIEVLNEEKIRLFREVQTLKDQLNQLELIIAKLREENQSLKSENAALQRLVQTLKSEVEELKRENADLKSKLYALTNKYESLVALYEKEKAEWVARHEQQQRLIEKLMKEKEKLEHDLLLLREECEKLRKQLEAKILEIRQLKEEYEARIRSLTDKVNVLTNELQAREKRILSLEATIREMTEEHRKVVAALRHELETEKDLNRQLNAELNAKKVEITRLTNVVAELNAVIKQLKEERAELLKTVEELSLKFKMVVRINHQLHAIFAEFQSVEKKFAEEIRSLDAVVELEGQYKFSYSSSQLATITK